MQSRANSFARIESDLALKVSEFPNQQHFKHKTIELAFTLFNNRKLVVYVFWTIQCFFVIMFANRGGYNLHRTVGLQEGVFIS